MTGAVAHSIELLPDDETDALIRAQWRALVEVEVSSANRHSRLTLTMLIAPGAIELHRKGHPRPNRTPPTVAHPSALESRWQT